MTSPLQRSWRIAPAVLAIAALAGCGTPVANVALDNNASLAVAQGIPPQSAFVVVQAKVTKILPEDTSGLPHQNFMVQVVPKGLTYTVNNDTKYGTRVADLQVGEELTIRGTTYNDNGHYGLHWTHKANVAGDAGYIKTPDGQIYQ